MSQTFWETETLEEQQPSLVPPVEAQEPPQAEAETEPEPAPLAVSVDDFSALEERIVRAVEVVKHERQLRAAAEDRAVKAEAQLGDQAPVIEQLKQEICALHAERDQVRKRVERLLSQLDALEL